jgi:hypothetical protein
MRRNLIFNIAIPVLAALCTVQGFAEGGAGGKGGVGLVCFSVPARSILVPSSLVTPGANPNLLTWPARMGEEVSDTYLVSWAKFYAVIDLVTRVEVDEYRDATTRVRGDTRYLHPVFWGLREAALRAEREALGQFPPIPSREARIALPQGFTLARLNRILEGTDTVPFTPTDKRKLQDYVDNQINLYDARSARLEPLFEKLYSMVTDFFKGTPGFYSRLKAAHEVVKSIYKADYNEASGLQADFYDLPPSSVPNTDPNCYQMAVALRKPLTEHRVQMLRDRYIWDNMDIFQQVLLQLHEEFYYLGSDSGWVLPKHENSEPARALLASFLKGENGKSGYASTCVSYGKTQSRFDPTNILIRSTRSCPGAGATDYIPAPLAGMSSVAFLQSFFCGQGEYKDCQLPPAGSGDVWQNFALYYGPYRQSGLHTLLSTPSIENTAAFGQYSTLDTLQSLKGKWQAWASDWLKPYQTLDKYCTNFEKVVSEHRENEDPRWILSLSKPGKAAISDPDLKRIGDENDAYAQITDPPLPMGLAYDALYSKVAEAQRSKNLVAEYPDVWVTAEVEAMAPNAGVPAELAAIRSLRPSPNGSNVADIRLACQKVKSQKESLDGMVHLFSGDLLNFFEVPASPFEHVKK